MDLVFRVLLLVGFVRALLDFEQPFLLAGLYAGGRFALLLVFSGGAFLLALTSALIIFVTASVFFWLLSKFDPASLAWWVILIVGVLVSFTTGLL